MAQFFHHNPFGYCLRCPRTRHLHLCFGNLALVATAVEFQEFRRFIEEEHARNYSAYRDPEARCIALRTPTDRMALVLSWQELEQLHEILETTALLLEVETLLG